ncbi:addiction module toxin RelE [Ensifer sp. NM-2]|uniref:type II toxin-antitoxin system RelE/ParE family toxin n=1 Tax=unclassified Ensifer TaxID=2633371 RepID=UPI000709143A|nr:MULTISPECIES: type II toxin-antitoxin system RelE/ParE family toxin [unclassified Ensifer]KQW55750.1 addiction module toxin RelE [Ensifer sp. Root127]PSS64553.1 addiction module toxin RelE [Ensifer sp. NM-2]
MKPAAPTPKPCVFLGSSKKDLLGLPDDVRQEMGYALHEAQCGEEPLDAKALKGFGGRSIIEIVKAHDRDTFRAVYTVRFEQALYVLHVFQKKSKKGIATPKHEIDLIKQRLRDAEEHYRLNFNEGGRKP